VLASVPKSPHAVSSEDGLDRELKIGEREGGDRFPSLEFLNGLIPFKGRMPKDIQTVLGQIHDPHFGNPESRVERDLHVAIEFGRRFGDLYEEQDILRPRMLRGIEVRTRFQERQIWLRLRELS
jgi:hypothetical protein